MNDVIDRPSLLCVNKILGSFQEWCVGAVDELKKQQPRN